MLKEDPLWAFNNVVVRKSSLVPTRLRISCCCLSLRNIEIRIPYCPGRSRFHRVSRSTGFADALAAALWKLGAGCLRSCIVCVG
eukprot:5221628-Amphidinium_carterae.2